MQATYDTRSPSSGFFKFLLILAAISILLIVATQLNFHAILQHGSDAETVRSCLGNGNPVYIGSSSDGRIFKVCQIAPFKYGIQVLAKESDSVFKEITSFIYRKEKGATIERVLEYLVRSGMTKP